VHVKSVVSTVTKIEISRSYTQRNDESKKKKINSFPSKSKEVRYSFLEPECRTHI
jgi:hypothetical protein